jgi:sec-independent protein translocase protein TatC
VITQIMMALPLMVLYEISIIGAKIFGKKKTEPKEVEQEAG